MKLDEYVKLQEEIAASNAAPFRVTDETLKNASPVDLVGKFSESIWVGRTINGEVFLFHGGHFLNISKTKQSVNDYYTSAGYLNQGFSKLDEKELATYNSVKIHLKKLFDSAFTIEIKPEEVASYLFNAENFDFTRE